MALSYSMMAPPVTPTAPLRLTPKTPREETASFSPSPMSFLPQIIYSSPPPSSFRLSNNGYVVPNTLGGHNIMMPPIPFMGPTAPPRGPTPPLSKRPSNKHLRTHSSTTPRNRPSSPFQHTGPRSAQKSNRHGISPSSYSSTRPELHPTTNHVNTDAHQLAAEGPIMPLPTFRHTTSFQPNSGGIGNRNGAGHTRSATVPVTLGGPASLDVQTAILMSQKRAAEAEQKVSNSSADPRSSHTERQEVHTDSATGCISPLSAPNNVDVPLILIHSPNQPTRPIIHRPSPLPRTWGSPIPAVNIELPSRRQSSIFSHHRASVFSRGHGSTDFSSMSVTSSPGFRERSLSELFEGVEKLNAEMGSTDDSFSTSDSRHDDDKRIYVELSVGRGDEDDDESIITNPEEYMQNAGHRESFVTNPEDEELYQTSLCAPSFLHSEQADRSTVLRTKRSSCALPRAHIIFPEVRPMTTNFHLDSPAGPCPVHIHTSGQYSGKEIDALPISAVDEHSDLLASIDELALAVQTTVPDSVPFDIRDDDEKSDIEVTSEPATPPRQIQGLKSTQPLIGVRSIIPSIRNESIISNTPIATKGLPIPKTPHLKPVDTTFLPPPRLGSINLPPARALRGVLRSNLPMEERGSQQWDREKVATDVRQVVQQLKWDRAQKAWRLVKDAEVVPITTKRDIPASPPGLQHVRFASTHAPFHRHDSVPMLPPGRLEWALVDPGTPSTTTDNRLIFRLCIAWRVDNDHNTFGHPFGIQEEVKVFVLGRTSEEFYALHEGLLENHELEVRRHQWTQPHEMGPRAKGCLENMENPNVPEDDDLNEAGWQVYKERANRKRDALETWVQGLMKLKSTSMRSVLEGELVRSWMVPKREGDCERVAGDWRKDGHGEVGFEERIARALEGSW